MMTLMTRGATTMRALRISIFLPAALVLVTACGRSDDNGSGDTTGAAPVAGRTTDSAAGMSEMAGMDHSKMPMGGSDTTVGAMTGMDHSNMPGMDHATTASRGGQSSGTGGGGMAGMDHSNMQMPARGGATGGSAGGMAGMDHSRMDMSGAARTPGAARPGSAGQPMAGMDHAAMGHGAAPAAAARQRRAAQPSNDMSAMDHSTMPMTRTGQPAATAAAAAGHEMHQMPGMPGMAVAPDSGTLKLQRLVARLVEDPAVRQRIQADTVLRNRWRDPDVREVVLP